MNNHLQQQLMSRQVWVDWLRLAATLLVIVCHACDPFLFNPNAAPGPEEGFWGALWQCSTRSCVPLFACMTGILLLPIRERLFPFWRKRISRVLWPFLIWSAAYCLFPWVYISLLGQEPAGVSNYFAAAAAPTGDLGSALADIAKIPLTFSIYGVHMWYVYLIIGLYLFIPILSAWVEQATTKEKYAVLALWWVTLFLPYAGMAMPELFGTCAWNSFGMLYYFAGFSGYLLLGHLASRWTPMGWPKALALALPLLVIGYVLTFVGFRVMQTGAYAQDLGFGEMLAYALNMQTPGAAYVPEHELFLLFCSPNVALMVTGVLLLFRSFNTAPMGVRRLLANFTAGSFGIYLTHYFFVGPANMLVNAIGIPMQLIIPCSALIVLPVTWCTVALLRRLIPGKWLLG